MGSFVDIFRRVWNWLSSPIPHGPVFLCRLDFTHATPCRSVDFSYANSCLTHKLDFTHTHPSDLDFIKGRD